MKVVRVYIPQSDGAVGRIVKSEKTVKERFMPKDRGQKAIKKPEQLKVKS